MSSASDGSYGGLSALAIINLGIWIPIIVMISAYFMCSTKYRYCKSIHTGKWCCFIKSCNDDEDFVDSIILRNDVESRVNDNDSDIYRISSGIGFESLEELQLWYNNFEENRQQARAGVREEVRGHGGCIPAAGSSSTRCTQIPVFIFT